jgi:hypothetical protein
MRRKLRVNSGGSVQCGPQQIAVSLLRHPERAGKVAVVNATGALAISFRIEPEQDARDFRPLGLLFGGVEKTDIEREVLSVIVCHAGALRGLIGKHDRVLLLSRFTPVQR